MLKRNLFRVDSRPAPALWAALFHHDDGQAAAPQKREKNPEKARKTPVDDSAAAARRRMIQRGLRTADTMEDGSSAGDSGRIEKTSTGARIVK